MCASMRMRPARCCKAPVSRRGNSPSPAFFDVTPHELITAIVTERGVVYPPFADNLPRLWDR